MAEPQLHVVGWDHHRCPVAMRERLAVAEAVVGEELAAICELDGIDEALFLSTCNRSECYFVGGQQACAVQGLIARRHGVDENEIRRLGYVRSGGDAVRHCFRVVSSLESLVLGEYQIAHQVKQAWQLARAAGFARRGLDPLFQYALAVGKRVRSETAIGRHKLSVASVAVDLARHIHGDLTRARLLVCGAGEMAELTVRHLVEQGVRQVGLVNRSQEKAARIAGLHEGQGVAVETHHWEALGEQLVTHDIVISSTAAPHPVIMREQVREALHRRPTPLMFVDLAVPRDVEPSVGELDDVYRYDIDDLDRIVAANRALRDDEVEDAERLVEQELRCWSRRSSRTTNRILADLSRWFDDVVDDEHARLRKKLPAAEELNGELRYGLQRVANKLNHRLLRWVKDHADDPEAMAMLNEILGLEDGEHRN